VEQKEVRRCREKQTIGFWQYLNMKVRKCSTHCHSQKIFLFVDSVTTRTYRAAKKFMQKFLNLVFTPNQMLLWCEYRFNGFCHYIWSNFCVCRVCFSTVQDAGRYLSGKICKKDNLAWFWEPRGDCIWRSPLVFFIW